MNDRMFILPTTEAALDGLLSVPAMKAEVDAYGENRILRELVISLAVGLDEAEERLDRLNDRAYFGELA